jgi:hypothetical protein
MGMIVSIHHYTLRAGVSDGQFKSCVAAAEERGLFNLPALAGYYFLKGIKGTRKEGYSAVWIYESREAWENLWGPADQPHEKNRYPHSWIAWEDEILVPVLDDDPDRIDFTSYECFS